VTSGELVVGIGDHHDPPVPIRGGVISPGDVLLYSFVVVNTSESHITSIQLYTSLTFGGSSTQDKLPPVPFSLAPGETRVIRPPAGFGPVRDDGTINISVSVLGVGPLPNVIAAADTATIEVRTVPG